MIAVIVNAGNDTNKGDSLTLRNLGRVFTSSVKQWRGRIDIKAYTRNESSGTYKVFQSLAMEGQDYGAATIKLESNEEIAKQVASDTGGIGYVGLSYAEAEGVKTLKIDDVEPKAENADKYPLSRKLYYYTIKDKLSPEGEAFIKWATTDAAAAEIVKKVGFIPLSKS